MVNYTGFGTVVAMVQYAISTLPDNGPDGDDKESDDDSGLMTQEQHL